MARKEYKFLTQEQVDHFMQHGFVRVEGCFTKEQADAWTKDVWVRLGWNPNDKSTWNRERINMPKHEDVLVAEYAPKAWGAACELVGGEEKIDEETRLWGNSLIVNVGTPEYEGKEVHPKTLNGWHVDGDFFVHYLDSPEQGLLTIPIFTDIEKDAGGTWICTEAMAKVDKHLYDHPEGVYPRMTPRSEPLQNENDLSWYYNTIQTCADSSFHEMTGKIGDVVLLHPLMCHSASKNQKRHLRIIINPRISLQEPFNFDREDGNYSLVEQKTLQLLGRESLPEWKCAGKREEVVPERVRLQAEMLVKEKERLAATKMGTQSQAPAVAAAS